MPTIADDLIILAVGLKSRLGPNTGQLPQPGFPRAMRAAELIALASAGRVEVDAGVISVRDTTPLGDPGLDAALALAIPDATRLSTDAAAAGVPVRRWMAAPRPGFVTARFERLAEAGLLRGERYLLLLFAPRIAYRLADQTATQRFEQLRAQLHAAVSSDAPLDAEHLALVGLVHTAGIARFAYPGRAGLSSRLRIASLAKQVGGLADAGQPADAPSRDVDPNLLFPRDSSSPQQHHHHAQASHSVPPAAQSTISSAVHAAVSASISTAVAAAIDAATHHHAPSGSGWMDSAPTHHHH